MMQVRFSPVVQPAGTRNVAGNGFRRLTGSVAEVGVLAWVCLSTMTLPVPSMATGAMALQAPEGLEWIPSPVARLEIRGLPWFKENTPELRRRPMSSKEGVPQGVWNQAVAPGGGRLCFASTTTRLSLHVQLIGQRGKPCFVEVFAKGQPIGRAGVKGREPTKIILFQEQPRRLRDLTVYLPGNQEVRLLAVGVDREAELQVHQPFALPRPLVCYGFAVLHGTGAAHPATTSPAAQPRMPNLDFVNRGFGGAGKAEIYVVKRVTELDACAFLFDLGKSHGAQCIEPNARLRDTIPAAHPATPVFCITPSYSMKEPNEPACRERSENLRTLMRTTAINQIRAGDQQAFVVERLELSGAADADAFNDPQHANDEGNERMAQRLVPLARRAVPGKTNSLIGRVTSCMHNQSAIALRPWRAGFLQTTLFCTVGRLPCRAATAGDQLWQHSST